jgi:hypothetical protein
MNSGAVSKPPGASSHLELRIGLNATPEQFARLVNLQRAFAEVCNALAPVVRETRCWNRVTLHHLAYRQLRERFPAMGSQMVCNAIYSVCRTSRMLFQHPDSPFNINRLGDKPLPKLQFTETCPVYFDRHTLSVKDGRLSMYTLDGRMRFELALDPHHELAFHEKKLHEIVLSRSAAGGYELCFQLAGETPSEEEPRGALTSAIPEYVVIQETA